MDSEARLAQTRGRKRVCCPVGGQLHSVTTALEALAMLEPESRQKFDDVKESNKHTLVKTKLGQQDFVPL